MKAPAFWWRPPGVPAALLHPAGLVVGAITARRLERTGARAPCPVICVGNFTVGGSGKTPTALALAGLLRREGREPAFLTRGYGGRLAGPVRVDPARHRTEDVGDEPLLLARAAGTIVARNRPAGAALAAATGASVVVMDDGLQNPSLEKDLALAVVDGATGTGNGLVLPAGPLRAPMAAQWPRVDALILIGEGERGAALARDAAARGKPALQARLVPEAATAARLAGRRVLAFAGIGLPEKFFATVAACGAEIVRRRAFPDHHVFRRHELDALSAAADAEGLDLVTTEKDLVRLDAPDLEFRRPPMALPVRLVFDDEKAVVRLLSAALRSRA